MEAENVEEHPWKWFVPPNARTLIAGTFPPTGRNWNYNFFYPNKNNLYWKIMAEIAGKPLQYFSGDEAVEERKEILLKLRTGVTDMAAIIRRNHDSSLDENIELVEYMDLFKILDENTLIKKIILTSSSGPSSAARWFINYLKTHNIIHHFPKGTRPLKSSFTYKDRLVEVVILYSPSGRAANRITMPLMVELYRMEINSE